MNSLEYELFLNKATKILIKKETGYKKSRFLWSEAKDCMEKRTVVFSGVNSLPFFVFVFWYGG